MIEVRKGLQSPTPTCFISQQQNKKNEKLYLVVFDCPFFVAMP
jgi:hypothetical protein